MTALAADRNTLKKAVGLQAYPVAASTLIYGGAMVALNSGGFAVPAADAASLKVVGKAQSRADNAAGANGDIKVLVEAPIRALFAATSITQAMVGQRMYVVDDQTFDDQPGTNAIIAGQLEEFVSTTSGWLWMDPTLAQAEAAQVAGVGNNYKIARGQTTTASASDTVVTGLATVVAVVASYDTDPADANDFVSASIGDQAGAPAAGSILIKTWKTADGADVTPVAATAFSKKVNWIAIGT